MKAAYIIAEKNGFARIPSIDEVADLGTVWIGDILTLAAEVERQRAYIDEDAK